MARTDTLGNFLTDVAEAIRTKEGTTETIPASEFDTRISNLSGGGEKYAPKFITFRGFTGTDLSYETSNLDTSNMTTFNNMFAESTYLKNVDLSKFQTVNGTGFAGLFSKCSSIQNLDLSSFNFTNATTLGAMFSDCTNLESVILPPAGAKADGVYNVFRNCSKLTTITWGSSGYITNGDCSRMFEGCTNLTRVDLSKFNVYCKYGSYMFNGCSNLQHINLGMFSPRGMGSLSSNRSGMLNGVPTDCEIITWNDSTKSWFNQYFPEYTNIKTVEEYEAEQQSL